MEKIKLNSCITIAKRISVSQTEQTTDSKLKLNFRNFIFYSEKF